MSQRKNSDAGVPDTQHSKRRPAVSRGTKCQKVAVEEEVDIQWEGRDETASLQYLKKNDVKEYPEALETVAHDTKKVDRVRQI